MDLVGQEKYEVKETQPREDPNYQMNNTILVDEDIGVVIQRGCPRSIQNPIIIEKLSLPPYPKSYNMIKQLKNTQTKICLFELIHIFKSHKEILYDVLKKRKVPSNIFFHIF